MPELEMVAVPKTVTIKPPANPIPKEATLTLPPTTTTEQDIHTASQRKINSVWEYSQAIIALTIVLANVAAAFIHTVGDAKLHLANAFFLIVGFYFGRTNHTNVGGIHGGR